MYPDIAELAREQRPGRGVVRKGEILLDVGRVPLLPCIGTFPFDALFPVVELKDLEDVQIVSLLKRRQREMLRFTMKPPRTAATMTRIGSKTKAIRMMK